MSGGGGNNALEYLEFILQYSFQPLAVNITNCILNDNIFFHWTTVMPCATIPASPPAFELMLSRGFDLEHSVAKCVLPSSQMLKTHSGNGCNV